MRELEKNYTRCFAAPSGEAVLRHLRSITIERHLGANASEAELRGLEAQRALVHMIEKLAGIKN
ncbi:MAG: hypothetical protein LBL46_01565 [Rickettsiales bacterium]|jgi:hypothetical protein|nr:hypothetical protein [Rickettsiales bacterium]